jgi:hypothetical protein
MSQAVAGADAGTVAEAVARAAGAGEAAAGTAAWAAAAIAGAIAVVVGERVSETDMAVELLTFWDTRKCRTVGIYLAPEDEDENNGEDDYNLDKHVMMEKSIQ